MARLQQPRQINYVAIGTSAVPLALTEINTTSFIVQASPMNTDFILLGNRSGQLYWIAPGKDVSIHGDGLDHGTYGYLNLEEWEIKSNSATQDASVTYLERF